ncbi:glycosyltransferase family 2 protein [Nautilia sp.]
MKISVVIIASDSEKTIKKCLESVKEFDEVVLYLSGSTDATEQIAEKFDNVRIVKGYFDGFGNTKNRAVSYASNDWVFILDSDEVVTDGLKKEIAELKFECGCYYVGRMNNFFGRWIKHGGLYPDYTVRLYDRNKARFNENMVHESVVCSGKKCYLKNHMLHYAYENIEEFITKQNRYSSLNAKPNRLKALISPVWTFFRMYVLKRGFLDGWEGFVIAKLYSQYTFWKYVKEKNEG